MSRRSTSVLITGCESGLGQALAKEFLRNGCHVVACAKDKSTLSSLEDQGIEIIQLDVSDIRSIKRARALVSTLCNGRLDVLVNSAALSYSLPATDVSMREVKSMFDVNLFGVMSMVQEFVHLLIASGDARVVNIGSFTGAVPFPFASAYNASQAALSAYGDTLRLELKPFNIRVFTMMSGEIWRASPPRRAWSLPSGSLYRSIKGEIGLTALRAPKNHEADIDRFSKEVVACVSKTSTAGKYWLGRGSLRNWFWSTFLWTSILERLIMAQYGLRKLQALASSSRQRLL